MCIRDRLSTDGDNERQLHHGVRRLTDRGRQSGAGWDGGGDGDHTKEGNHNGHGGALEKKQDSGVSVHQNLIQYSSYNIIICVQHFSLLYMEIH